MGRRPLGVFTIACLVIALVATSAPASALAAAGDRPKLTKHSRELVATAIANRDATVTLLFATEEAKIRAVVSALRALGADVRKQDADAGYIRANVPTAVVDQAANLDGVLAADADEVFDLVLPSTGDGGDAQVDPPGSATPAQNPYLPTRDTGAPQFVAAHPTWDGRGITVGILDAGVDVGHPALQTTTTGERKIVDWVSFTDPVGDGDPAWIALGQTVTVTEGTFTVGTGSAAKTWTGAPDGIWKFGTFNEDSVPFARPDGTAAAEYRSPCFNRPVTPPTTPPTFQMGGDLNRNNICGETFGFLWDGDKNGYVWVDSDADMSFADERGMREFIKAHEIGEYGHDDPATPLRESVPFVVQIDAASSSVNLGVVSGAHGTHVAGITAGRGLFGSADGAAPGAQIVSIRVCLFTSGCTAHALIEGMIFAVKDKHVDVVNMSIGSLPALNDGNTARDILYNRLIDKWGAQLIFSGGNSGPGVNTAGDPAVATKVLAVGAYWHRDSVLANYGNEVSTVEALHDFSSRGPREDGGFKPDVVAPGNAVSSVPTWQPGQPVVGTYALPPGLGMLNGTSMAAPQTTGAAALLLSAAKQSDVGHKPEQLRMALRSSARMIAGYQPYEQGDGLIDVGAAWDLLASNLKVPEITSSVPVSSKLSDSLARPGIGVGIYEREGVAVGAAPFTRTYTFTRTDGGSATYELSLVGNDGTFSLDDVSSIALRKGGSANVTVRITPGAAGVHSAILRLDDPRSPGYEYETLNTVIVSIPLNAANGYTATVAATAGRFEAGQPRAFFTVPDGATAMRVTLRVINGRVNATPVHTFGVPLTGASQVIPLTTGPATLSRVITTGPTAGVWEVTTSASRSAGPAASTYEVTFEAFKVALAPSTWTVDPAAVGTPYEGTFSATNELAAVSTDQVGGAFASVLSRSATIVAGGAQQPYDISVPAGTTSLNVSIGGASDSRADLDLFVYNCVTGTRVLAGAGRTSSANESVTISSPAPGAWRAVVDPFSIPTGRTTYTYTESLANPAYGSVTVPANSVTARAAGASWSFTATGRATAPAGTGRQLRATIRVREGVTGSTLGTAVAAFATP